MLALAGIGIGVAGALALTRVLSAFLFGVGATDPVTFALRLAAPAPHRRRRELRAVAAGPPRRPAHRIEGAVAPAAYGKIALMHRALITASIAVVALVSATAQDNPTTSRPEGPKEFKALKYRYIGPAAGGRVSRAAGVAGNPSLYYAATASGGVWKSTDGGTIVEADLRRSAGLVDRLDRRRAVRPERRLRRLRRSEHSRKRRRPATASTSRPTPARPGPTSGSRKARSAQMAVHPRNPDVAFAAVLGHAFGPNPERGVYRTTDGGKTWRQVLKKDENTGASDVDASIPPTRRSSSPASGRRGATLGSPERRAGQRPLRVPRRRRHAGSSSPANGLPEGIWGKVGIAIAPSDGRRVYALIEAEKGGLFRSDDGGENWQLVNPSARAAPARLVLLDADGQSQPTPTRSGSLRCRCCTRIDGGKTLDYVKGLHHGDQPRRLDRSAEPEADDRRQRRRRRHLQQRRRDLVRAAAADLRSSTMSRPTTDGPYSRRRRHAGPRHGARTERQPDAARHPPDRLARRRRRRGRPRRLRPSRSRTSSTPGNTSASSRGTTIARASRATSARGRTIPPATAAKT